VCRDDLVAEHRVEHSSAVCNIIPTENIVIPKINKINNFELHMFLTAVII
jgi:hypothetical protein